MTSWYRALEVTATEPIEAISFGPLVQRPCPMCSGTRTRPILADQYYALATRDIMAVVE